MTERSLLINNIIALAALALVAVILLTIPFRIKKQGREGLKNRGRAFWLREISIFISSIAICILCIFIHFELVPTLVLCACGPLATWAGVQELFPKA
ncbi:MAG: hypothetical protein IKR64_10105 [Treponema sp.]|nr:hypothetical protein [Treponema sp.]